MRKYLFILLSLVGIMASAQNKIYITANGETRSVTLAENTATARLAELLSAGDFTIKMSDYGGWEKVGNLPESLPTSNSQLTAQPGDIMLYMGNQMVIFYGSNSWSYTRLGKIDITTNLKSWLGNGNVDILVSLTNTHSVDMVIDKNTEERVYDMMGRPINHTPLAPGLYIINGKKTIIR